MRKLCAALRGAPCRPARARITCIMCKWPHDKGIDPPPALPVRLRRRALRCAFSGSPAPLPVRPDGAPHKQTARHLRRLPERSKSKVIRSRWGYFGGYLSKSDQILSGFLPALARLDGARVRFPPPHQNEKGHLKGGPLRFDAVVGIESASGTDKGLKRTRDMNCFMSRAVKAARACGRE